MITSAELGPNDILVLRVAVGNMPLPRAKNYMDEVEAKVQEAVGSEQKILTFATQDGDTEIGVLKRP